MSDMPTGWAIASLSEIAVFITDGDHNPPKRVPEGVPHLTARNVRGGHLVLDRCTFVSHEDFTRMSRRYAPLPGDVIVTCVGTLGQTAIVPDGLSFSADRNLAAIRPSGAVLSSFLKAALDAPEHQATMQRGSGSTAQPHLYLGDLRVLTILVPPLAEQQRIVAVIEEQFSRLDTGAAVLERVRRNLKHMRATVLYAGVTGRLVGQEPGEGMGADLLASIKLDGRRMSRRKENLVTSMPQLPQSWATARWSDVGWSQNGRAFPSADYAKEGVRLLRPGNLYESGQVGWTAANTRCLPQHYAHEFPDYTVGPNEIVMNLTAQSLKDEFLGRVCMTGPQDERVLLNQRIARLTPVGMNPRFVFYALKSPVFRRFVDQLNTGSLIQHMFTSQLDQFVLPVPPRREQDRIVDQIEQYLACLDYVDSVVAVAGQRVPALRAAILSTAFSGRLVSQNPDDEPASALIERIASELEGYNGNKRGRANKSLLPREGATL